MFLGFNFISVDIVSFSRYVHEYCFVFAGCSLILFPSSFLFVSLILVFIFLCYYCFVLVLSFVALFYDCLIFVGIGLSFPDIRWCCFDLPVFLFLLISFFVIYRSDGPMVLCSVFLFLALSWSRSSVICSP
jgi:hypothetical protein